MKRYLLFALTLILATGCGAPKPEVDLWTAAGTGNIAEIQKHIDFGSNLNEKEPAGGSTPLIVAVATGQAEPAKLLVENGADLEVRNNDGSTALMTAVFFCRTDLVNLLLKNGAEVNVKGNTGKTPLDVVSVEWTPALEGIYKMVAGALQLPIDLERIKKDRTGIAAILKKHGAKTSGEL